MDNSADLVEAINQFFCAVEQEEYDNALLHLEEINVCLLGIDLTTASNNTQLLSLLVDLNSNLSSCSSALVVILKDIVAQLRPKNSSTDLTDGVVYRKNYGKL